MGTWTIIHSQSALEAAMSLARGSYQKDILQGYESLSGSTLKGKARNYGAKYAASRRSLFDRLQAAGIPFFETTGERNARILVIG